MNGFVKLRRKDLKSPLAQSDELLGLYVRVLAAVNYQTGFFKKYRIELGSMAFSWRELPERLYPNAERKPAINTLRNRLDILEAVGAIEIATHESKNFSVLRVIDYPHGAAPKSGAAGVSESDAGADTVPDTEVNTDIRRVTKRKKRVAVLEQIVIPEELNKPEFLEVWREWNEYRKAKRIRISKIGVNRQLSELKTYGLRGAIESLNRSMANEWKGIFEPRRDSDTAAIVKSVSSVPVKYPRRPE